MSSDRIVEIHNNFFSGAGRVWKVTRIGKEDTVFIWLDACGWTMFSEGNTPKTGHDVSEDHRFLVQQCINLFEDAGTDAGGEEE